MRNPFYYYLLIAAGLVIGAPAGAQSPCPPAGKTTTTAKLATCVQYQARQIDSLRALVASGTGNTPTGLEARFQKLELWESQGRATMGDFYSKLPPDGRSIREYVNSAVFAVSGPANTVDGDFIVNGKVCIGGPCDSNTIYQLQLFGPASTGIIGYSNRNGANGQGPQTHVSALTFGEDGGFRLEHNYRYQNGRGIWQESAKPRSVLGFDSQGTPSFSQDYDGQIYPSQSLVIGTDKNARTILFQSMKAGWKFGLCSSPDANNACTLFPVPLQ